MLELDRKTGQTLYGSKYLKKIPWYQRFIFIWNFYLGESARAESTKSFAMESNHEFHQLSVTEKGMTVLFHYKSLPHGKLRMKVTFPPFSVLGSREVRFEVFVPQSKFYLHSDIYRSICLSERLSPGVHGTDRVKAQSKLGFEDCVLVTPVIIVSQQQEVMFLQKVKVELPWIEMTDVGGFQVTGRVPRRDILVYQEGVCITSFSFSPVGIKYDTVSKITSILFHCIRYLLRPLYKFNSK